jgi:hypothetical protein
MPYGDKRYDNYKCDHCGAEWRIGGVYFPDKEHDTVLCKWCREVLFSGLTRESFAEWELLKEGDAALKAKEE